jgi:ribosomal protein L11 methyltransferase
VAAGLTWGWRRWIPPGSEDKWIAQLQTADCATWTLTERPDRKRILLAVYNDKRETVLALRDRFGGIVRSIRQSEWLPTKPEPPTRIGPHLEIIHGSRRTPGGGRRSRLSHLPVAAVVRRRTSPQPIPALHIPHGLAFGSGEHATTYMLLRALTAPRDWPRTTVLDLGTGSGVLALAARLFGARKILATDFDPEAVRTARQNETLNFATPLIRWRCADVRKLSSAVRHHLVLANLFSGILCEAAPQIAAAVAPGGQLWLSGILHTQQKEVIAAYRAQGLHLVRINRRGKWIMLQLRSRRRETADASVP